jgi:hypothetical protein
MIIHVAARLHSTDYCNRRTSSIYNPERLRTHPVQINNTVLFPSDFFSVHIGEPPNKTLLSAIGVTERPGTSRSRVNLVP